VWTGGLSAELYGRLVRAARTADVVHAHTVPLPHNYVAWLAARLAGRPFVITPHFHMGDEDHEHPHVRWLLRHADRVLAVTETERDALAARGVPAARLVTAGIALETGTAAQIVARDDLRAALGIPLGAPIVAFLGRKTATKGIDVLLAAVPLIRHRPEPVIVAAGPTTEWYRSLAPSGRAGILDLGTLSETAKASLLAAADVLVLPSRHEAFGFVFLEAWAAGTPVVGADIPAVREAIADAGTTFAVDDAADLAARIDAVLADRDAALRQVARGRERLATMHTWERVGPRVELAYEEARRTRRRVPAHRNELVRTPADTRRIIP
jgi:glycogen(starch) synthase